MAKKPRQHDPTPEERDERVKIEGLSDEEALKILLGALNDEELDAESPSKEPN